ncbi:MAG: LUD domain-containing protein [Alphaproteobacteria bacterium]|nr:LUD domain-containing protein [Alphaproteobacteria bacterium]
MTLMPPAKDAKREAILGNIRTALGRRRGGPENIGQENAGDDAAILSPDELRHRLDRHATAPSLSRLAGVRDEDGRVALFTKMAETLSVKFTNLGDVSEIPGQLARILAVQQAFRQSEGASRQLAVAPALRDVPWHLAPTLNPHFGEIREGAVVSVQQAFAGIAETGSLMVCSSPDHPTTLNFLGDYCVVILRAADIVPSLEEAWQKWRKNRAATDNPRHNEVRDPRLVNIITGPSRTADIEGKILLGAHGPAELHIFLVA